MIGGKKEFGDDRHNLHPNEDQFVQVGHSVLVHSKVDVTWNEFVYDSESK